MLNFDLHSHSRVSDGVLSPTELVERAHANGVRVLALTDHDEVGGITEAKEAAAKYGMQLVSGVEISITWAATSIHIVGLHVDENDPVLIDMLRRNRSGRTERAKRMGERLDRLGIPGAYEGALKYVTNPNLISRKHFARFLVESGTCPTISNAFEKYLRDGGPAYVPHQWATLTEAMEWILNSGGIAIVAHPGRYPLKDVALHAFLDEFKQLGGTGIEAVTGSHSPDQYLEFSHLAKRYGLQVSAGSDFHAPGESPVDVGCLPDFPCPVDPVWKDWK
mgnify:CR=1 FL=1